MAIDHGEKRLGVAVSDPLGIVASPRAIINRGSKSRDFEQLLEIIASDNVQLIVVGLPTDSNGEIGMQAGSVLRWASALASATDLPIRLWDESYSSADAAHSRHLQGKRGKVPMDDVAAAFILQSYLEARGSGHEPGYPLEALKEER